MPHKKISIGVLLAAMLLITQVFVAGAAPLSQDSPPIIGNVDNIELQTNPDTLETTVLVTISGDAGKQTLELSLKAASDHNLVELNDMYVFVVNGNVINTTIKIDTTAVISEVAIEETEEEHPVGSALADFFNDVLGVDYGTVMEYHDDGYGFGVITQALWMTNVIDGDADTFTLIVEAKKTNDFSGLGVTLPDGSEPTNWGQFRKAVMSDREKAKENLGSIMSGRAEKPGEGTLLEEGADAKSNNGKGIGNSNTTLDNENNGKNTNNGNSANNKDKSNNGKDKDKKKNK